MNPPYDGPYPDGPPDLEGWKDDDFIIVKWGQPLVNHVRSPDFLARCLEQLGVSVTGEAVMAAAECGEEDSLYFLFFSGGSPNMRAARASPADAGVDADWATRDADIAFRNPRSQNEPLQVEWFPLQAVAHTRERLVHKEKQMSVIRYLLEEGANPYALYRAPFDRPKFHRYPGETFDELLDPRTEEDDDVYHSAHLFKYGTRSVLHSIFEDEGQALPFLDEKFGLDIEHRDPQGRTLLHSACRRENGADALLNSTYYDWQRRDDSPEKSQDVQLSFFHALRLRHANMLAVDSRGQHIVHHLLQGGTCRDALSYTLTNLPQLANQPDHHGLFPLHVALQSLRRTTGQGVEYYAECIEQLLAAGADPLVCDGRGNTALHYLAASPFSYSSNLEAGQALFERFVALGVDINAHNKAELSAIEIFLDDECSGRTRVRGLPPTRSFYGTSEKRAYVPLELLTLFDKANIDWSQKAANGQTLLHLVALQQTEKALEHAEYLLVKGVDASLQDKEGKTAADVAEQYGRDKMLKVLLSPPIQRVQEGQPEL